jgi:hypothetical protein
VSALPSLREGLEGNRRSFALLRMTKESEKQIPEGNDRKNSKGKCRNNGKGKCRNNGKGNFGFFAAILCLLGILLVGGVGLRSQVDAGSGAFRTDAGGVMNQAAFRQRAIRLNIERQRRMDSDSERLVVLAAALKGEVDAGRAEGSSSGRVGLVHEADQIAKLAHGVKERMSDGIQRGAH